MAYDHTQQAQGTNRVPEAPDFAFDPTKVRQANGLAMGIILFASIGMMILGLFHGFFGLAGILSGTFLVTDTEYPYEVDSTWWGIWHLFLGGVVLTAGCLLFSGKPWAMIVALVVAVVSGVDAFLSIPYHPLWSILILAFSIGVIWAITAHGKEVIAAAAD